MMLKLKLQYFGKGKPLSGPRDPQVLLACLGHLALGDLVPLGHQDPRDHQDLQLS